MNFARWAGMLALLGGVCLAVSAILAFADSSSAHDAALYAGYALMAVALMCVGYTTVAHAPMWLRLIVVVAAPLLAAMVWSIVVSALDSSLSGSSQDGVVAAIAAVLSLALAGVELRSSGKTPRDDYWAGRRH
jgi:hypothetical protein